MVVYGVQGYVPNVDPRVFDTLYVLEIGRMELQTDLDLHGIHVQYTRPESGCLHSQTDGVRSRPEPEIGARRLISGTGSKRFNRSDGGLKSWQTDSIGSDGDSSSWQESIGLSEVSSRVA